MIRIDKSILQSKQEYTSAYLNNPHFHRCMQVLHRGITEEGLIEMLILLCELNGTLMKQSIKIEQVKPIGGSTLE